MFVVSRRFQRNELLWRFAEFDESKILLGDGRPQTGRPNGRNRICRFLWSDHTLLVHNVHQQINIVRMSFQSLLKTRVIIEAIRAQMVQTICRYSYLHFCIIAAFFFSLLNYNELSHNLFHLLAISGLWMFTNRSKELIFQSFNHTKRECLIL